MTEKILRGWIERRPDPIINQPCACGEILSGRSASEIADLYAEHLRQTANPEDHELEEW